MTMAQLFLISIYTLLTILFNNIKASPIIYINKSYILGQQKTLNRTVINEYLGIPYADPPVGSLRFQKPRAIQNYPPILEAFTNPPACPQYTTQPYPWYVNTSHQSEDCLYLNIWTPADASPTNKKAVLYWIHGGGFRYGSIRDELYSGIALASLGDVVVVTVNYRLGPFGFFTTLTEDAPPNVGLHDILEGLKWVNSNIGAFGGDVQRITISGESAGSLTVGYFTMSPLASGLYTRLIMQSGTALTPGSGSNDVLGQKLAEKSGCANETFTLVRYPKEIVQCLRNVSTEVLTTVDFEIKPHSTSSFSFEFGDELLPDHPSAAIFSGHFRCTDLLIGTNKDEGSFDITTSDPDLYGFFGEKNTHINKTMGKNKLQTFVNTLFPHSPLGTEAILQYYFSNNKTSKAHKSIRHQVYSAISDIVQYCPEVYYSEKCAEQNQNVYAYYFTHRPSTTPWAKWMGVAHFEEVQFVFGKPLLSPEKYHASEVELSRQIIGIWSNFVKTGKPDISWSKHSGGNPVYKYLGPKTVTGKEVVGLHRQTCNFLRPLFNRGHS